jgi:apoptosis-inducing factor 3
MGANGKRDFTRGVAFSELSDGSLVTPLHHACFDLRTGKALRAPALDPITCWRVERIGDTAFVREKLPPSAVPRIDSPGLPRSVVIVGGGAAGLSAAHTLRQSLQAELVVERH